MWIFDVNMEIITKNDKLVKTTLKCNLFSFNFHECFPHLVFLPPSVFHTLSRLITLNLFSFFKRSFLLLIFGQNDYSLHKFL